MHATLAVGLVLAVAFIFPSEACQCTFPDRYYTGQFSLGTPDPTDPTVEYRGPTGRFHVDLVGRYFKGTLRNHNVLGDIEIYAKGHEQTTCKALGKSKSCQYNKKGNDFFDFLSCVSDRATCGAVKDMRQTCQYKTGRIFERYEVQPGSDDKCTPMSLVGLEGVGFKKTYYYDEVMTDLARDEEFYSANFTDFTRKSIDILFG